VNKRNVSVRTDEVNNSAARDNTRARKAILRQLQRTTCSIAEQIFTDEILRLKLPAKRAVALIRRWQLWRDDLVAVHRAQNAYSKMSDELSRAIARRAIHAHAASVAKRL
jgi:hypothetical protein